MADSNLQNLWESTVKWSRDFFWNENVLYEGLILIGAFVFGRIFYGIAKKHIIQAIDSFSMPIRIKRICKNLVRLVFPLMTLIVAFVAGQLANSELIGLDTSLITIATKLLLAWIVIRIVTQIIENNVVRNIFASAIWFIAALSIFGVLDQTTETLDAIGFSIGEFRLSALAVIKGALSLFALLYIALFASTFLERQVFRASSLTRSSQVLIAKIIRIALIVFAVFIGVTSAGIDLSIFAVLSGAIGLGIGFGLQKVVSNLFSGLLLLMDQSIKPGDVIELQDSGTFGWVNNMAARYTEIVTRDNKSFLIPNEDFITQRVVNWSHGNSLIRISVEFGVHYDADPHKVIEIATEAAKKPERVVEDREPVCWITEFGDSSVNFTLRFWIKDSESGVTNVRGEVLLALWDTLKENNIEIPYPQRVVHMVPPPSSEST